MCNFKLTLSELRPKLNNFRKEKQEVGEEMKVLDYFTRENKEYLNQLNSKFEVKYEAEFKDFLFKFEKPVRLVGDEKEKETGDVRDVIKYDYGNVFLGESVNLVGKEMMGQDEVWNGGQRLWNEREGKGLGLNFLGEQIGDPEGRSGEEGSEVVLRIKQEFENEKRVMMDLLMSRDPVQVEEMQAGKEESEEDKGRLENIYEGEEEDMEVDITTETELGTKRNMINSNHFETDSQTLKGTTMEFSMTETEKIREIPEEKEEQMEIAVEEKETDFEEFQSDYKEDKISLKSIELEYKGSSMSDVSKNKVYSIQDKSQEELYQGSETANSGEIDQPDSESEHDLVEEPEIPQRENGSEKLSEKESEEEDQLKIVANEINIRQGLQQGRIYKDEKESIKEENVSERRGIDSKRGSELTRSKRHVSVNTQDLEYSDGIEDYEEEVTQDKNPQFKKFQNRNNAKEEVQERSKSVDDNIQKPLKRMSNTLEIQEIPKQKLEMRGTKKGAHLLISGIYC